MSTVDLKQAQVVREHNGVYPGDEHLPPIVEIWRYTSTWGTDCYKLVYRGQPRPAASEYVRNPVLWWSRT